MINEATQESLQSNRDPLHMYCIVLGMYTHLLDVPKQPTCMNGRYSIDTIHYVVYSIYGYRELHQQLQSRLGARGQNGTRASAHVTFQRTTSERKLFLCQTLPATVLFG